MAEAAAAELPREAPHYRVNLMMLVRAGQAGAASQTCGTSSAVACLPANKGGIAWGAEGVALLSCPPPLQVRAQMGTAPPNWPPGGDGSNSEEAQVLARAQARAAPQLASLEAQALRMMDGLVDAGYRVRVFKGEPAARIRWGRGFKGGWVHPASPFSLCLVAPRTLAAPPPPSRRPLRRVRRRHLAHGARGGPAAA